MKLDLKRVTLVTVDTVCHELTRLALDDCTAVADYGEVIIFSDRSISAAANHMCVKCEVRNTKDVSDIYYKTLPHVVRTEFMMIVHWDSWILRPECWRDEFLNYDYIGAPWLYPFYNVGNSGFSIRSTEMARYIARNEKLLEHAFPDDAVICRRHRPHLDEHGFRFAPSEVAAHFAFERSLLYPVDQIFGFHGIFHWPVVLSGERLAERVKLARANEYVKSRVEYPEFERNLKAWSQKCGKWF